MSSGWLVITERTQHYPLSQEDAQEVSQRSQARKEAGFVVANHGCTWLSVKSWLAKNSSLQVSAAPEAISPASKSLGRGRLPSQGPAWPMDRHQEGECLLLPLLFPLSAPGSYYLPCATEHRTLCQQLPCT